MHGFFNDLIRQIGVPEIEEQLIEHRRGRAGQERRLPEAVALMAFERACALAEVPDGRGRSASTVGGLDVAVARDGDEVFAVAGRVLARRRRAERGRGRRTAQIECWLHGSRFDLRTGKPTGLPGHRAGRRSSPSRSATTSTSTRPTLYVDIRPTTLNGVDHRQ